MSKCFSLTWKRFIGALSQQNIVLYQHKYWCSIRLAYARLLKEKSIQATRLLPTPARLNSNITFGLQSEPLFSPNTTTTTSGTTLSHKHLWPPSTGQYQQNPSQTLWNTHHPSSQTKSINTPHSASPTSCITRTTPNRYHHSGTQCANFVSNMHLISTNHS